MQVIIHHFDALALMKHLAAVLFIKPKRLNLPTLFRFWILGKHLREEVCIIIFAADWYSNCAWVILNHFLVFILKQLSSTLHNAVPTLVLICQRICLVIPTQSLSADNPI